MKQTILCQLFFLLSGNPKMQPEYKLTKKYKKLKYHCQRKLEKLKLFVPKYHVQQFLFPTAFGQSYDQLLSEGVQTS